MSVFMKSLPPESWTTTSTGSLVRISTAIVCGPPATSLWRSSLGELIFGRRDDQAQQVRHARLGGGIRPVAIEAQVAVLLGELQQRAARLRARVQRPDQLQALLHEAVRWKRLTEVAQAAHDRLHPWRG